MLPVSIVAFITWAEGELKHWIIYLIFAIGVTAFVLIYDIDYRYIVVAGVSFTVGVLFTSKYKK